MARFRINNGFPNTRNNGCFLAGILLSGEIQKGDLLILKNGIKVPIDKVEQIIIKGFNNRYSLEISETNSKLIAWFKYYGKEIEIEKKVPPNPKIN